MPWKSSATFPSPSATPPWLGKFIVLSGFAYSAWLFQGCCQAQTHLCHIQHHLSRTPCPSHGLGREGHLGAVSATHMHFCHPKSSVNTWSTGKSHTPMKKSLKATAVFLAFFSNCEEPLLQSCEEFRHSSSTDPLCVPKIDYSSVLCAYLHIKTVLILSKFRPQSLCSCTYFQPPWKRSLKTQVIFSLWTRAMVQYICNGGTICLHSGEYVECSQRTSHRFW